MPSDRKILTTLATDLRRLGLNCTADELNDIIAQSTRKRWSATVLLEHIVAAELEEKQRRSVESRLKRARLGRFKPLADWDWEWPTALDRPALERILSLDFLAHGDNVVILGAQGLGKTMLAKNIAHQAILAGKTALFTTAADLLLDLNGQETARALERRLRHYTRPALLCVDELGYLAYDVRAADLIFQIVSRRYEHRSLLITTNLPFPSARGTTGSRPGRSTGTSWTTSSPCPAALESLAGDRTPGGRGDRVVRPAGSASRRRRTLRRRVACSGPAEAGVRHPIRPWRDLGGHHPARARSGRRAVDTWTGARRARSVRPGPTHRGFSRRRQSERSRGVQHRGLPAGGCGFACVSGAVTASGEGRPARDAASRVGVGTPSILGRQVRVSARAG